MSKYLIALLFSFTMASAWSQMNIVGIPRHTQETTRAGNSSKIEATHLLLPFWDDFSKANGFPSAEKWAFSSNVWVSHGAGINPPTLNVATFDGVDGQGRLYSIDQNPDGLCDVLTSKMFDLTPYTPANNLYLSFFYQAKGNGEIPNPNDSLRLEFRDNLGNWVYAWSVNGANISPDQFIMVSIPIDQAKFFHPDFEFQFKSYGRQTGPYDNWHLDYVYLNHNVSNFDFPDRALQHPPSNIFEGYSAIPIHHYKENPALYNGFARSTGYNLHNLLQPSNFSMVAEISNLMPDLSYDIRQSTLANQISSSFPDPLSTGIRQIDLVADTYLDPAQVTSDTLAEISLQLFINTDDNTAPDYDPVIYAPVDFRENDTTYTRFTLHDYYAYDDGTAEYGAGLNYAGDMVVVAFPMNYSTSDTLVSMDMYFPNIGSNINQAIDVIVVDDNGGFPGNIIHKETFVVKNSTALNSFSNYALTRPVVVKDLFYIGWKQNKSEALNIGLDKNNDNGSKMYYNLDGTWQQNTSVKGSLMLRPRFGSADIITSAPPINNLRLYPNPGTDHFVIEGNCESIVIRDINGNTLPIAVNTSGRIHHFSMNGYPAGIYIIQVVSEGKAEVKRLIKL